jgi:hypothetical protein
MNGWELAIYSFLAGVFVTIVLIVAFWASETRRYQRRYKRPDEHATHYTYYGTRPPKS